MNLTASVTGLSGIGANFAAKLARLNISSVFDLLYHLPFRFEDRGPVTPVSAVRPGHTVTIKGAVVSIKNEYTKSGKFIQKAVVSDPSGSIDIIWFNQTYLVKALYLKQAAFYGKADFFGKKIAIVSPEYELNSTELIHMARIVPVYPETAGISSKWLRTKIFSLLKTLPDTDPWPAPDHPGWKQSLSESHFPTAGYQPQAQKFRDRLAFDELFLLQSKSLLLRQNWQNIHLSHSFSTSRNKVLDFIAGLPFTLTASQNSSIKEILSDLSRTVPMNRLLEGDVGSGKTVVAAVAAYVAYLNGFQTVVLAPTQILAAQHYQTLSALFKPYGLNISLITGQSKLSTSHLTLSTVFVGTHALFSDKNQEIFRKVGLVVIDEQHRFGVIQRSLASKFGISPHILTMTATPIPRSVALTMFGNLDLSRLTDKPIGRLPVKTWVIPEVKRRASYLWISSQLQTAGHKLQAFWVCPFINASESVATVKAVTSEYERLGKIFPEFRLGLLHGKLKSAEKDRVVGAFRAGEYDILVTTPIVEVGIDIPNAALIVIEAAERFGLAQLHQLRGRVGRSDIESYCLLFTSSGSVPDRLKALESIDSGVNLAELDLKYRGPGEIYGTAQHGFPQFKIAGFDNLKLISQAKIQAETLISGLSQYPVLQELVKTDKITFIQPN